MSKLIINKLVVVGEGQEDAIVHFNTGLNVISGSSDTGKTYIFQCLKYLLGSSSKPKENLDEAVGYSHALLEIQADKAILTLERSLLGGDVKVHFGNLDNARSGTCKFETMNAEAKGKNNLSKHILKIMGLSGVTVVKAKTKGQKAEMHLSDFREIIFIDETKIISEGSPFLSGVPTNRSKEKTFLNYLVTGKDYKEAPLSRNNDEVRNSVLASYLKNEIELEITKKKQINSESSQYKINDIENKLLHISSQLEELQDNYKLNQKDKDNAIELLTRAKSKSKVFLEIISRFQLLQDQYDIDSKRLDHLNESSDFFKLFKSSQCPVCFSKITTDHKHNNEVAFNIENYSKSIINERNKISLLAKDLKDTINDTQIQKNQIDNEVNLLSTKVKDLDDKQRAINSKISESSLKLKNLITLEKRASELEMIDSRIDKLTAEIKQYIPEPGQKKKKETSDIDSVLADVRSKLCKEFSKNLKKINYYSTNESIFDEKSTDFIISGKPRKSFGKGYRAISYSAAYLALLNLSSLKQTSMNLLILDSPLTTHDGKHENVDGQDIISKEMEQLFFELLVEQSSNLQIIVFDNKIPSPQIISKINFIEFTGNESYGRYGFFPKGL